MLPKIEEQNFMNSVQGTNINCDRIVPITVPKDRKTAVILICSNGLRSDIVSSVTSAVAGSTRILKRIVATPFITEDKSVTPLASG